MKKWIITLSDFFQNVFSIIYLSILDKDINPQVLSIPIVLSIACFVAFCFHRNPWTLICSCFLATVPTLEKVIRVWAEKAKR